MPPSRCRTGTSSPSPSQTSSSISAFPGKRHPLPQRVPPPLISCLPAAPAISSQTPPKRVPSPQRTPRHSRLCLDQASNPRCPLVLTPPWARKGGWISYPSRTGMSKSSRCPTLGLRPAHRMTFIPCDSRPLGRSGNRRFASCQREVLSDVW
jgi:hypothetical protein